MITWCCPSSHAPVFLSFSCPHCTINLRTLLPSTVQWETLQAVVNLAVRRSSFYNLVFNSEFTILQVHGRRSQSYEPLLLENEREAVADLLQYLESMEFELTIRASVQLTQSIDRTSTNFFTGSPLAALTTLSFSDNVDLQRSAALAFAEITEKEVRPVGRDTLDPILFLLSSHDTEVQRAASAALGNLAVNSAFIHQLFQRLLMVIFSPS